MSSKVILQISSADGTTRTTKIMNHNPLVTAIWLQAVAKLAAGSAIDFLRLLVAETNIPKINLL